MWLWRILGPGAHGHSISCDFRQHCLDDLDLEPAREFFGRCNLNTSNFSCVSCETSQKKLSNIVRAIHQTINPRPDLRYPRVLSSNFGSFPADIYIAPPIGRSPVGLTLNNKKVHNTRFTRTRHRKLLQCLRRRFFIFSSSEITALLQWPELRIVPPCYTKASRAPPPQKHRRTLSHRRA
jgi:hypothetical protein